MKSFRELIVWQKSMQLVKLIYEISLRFPESEKFGLTNQIRRAAVSVPSNIAEGFGRHSTPDYIRFLQIASGSLYELQTQLEISLMLQFADDKKSNEAENLATECAKMLTSLIARLKEKSK